MSKAQRLKKAAAASGTRTAKPGRRSVVLRFAGWVTTEKHSTYSFALLRIVYGAGMLIFLLPSLPDRHYLWGVASGWVEPEAKRRGWWEIFRVLFSKDNAFLFDVAYGVLIMLVLIFIIGWRTKWVTPLLLLFWVGLQSNSMLLTNGGDTIMRITLVFLMFADLSQKWSLDAWLASKRGTPKPVLRGRLAIPAWLGSGLHNTALMLCCYQIILVYVNSGIYKLLGDEWRNGSAVYYSLVIDEFRGFPLLSDLVWQITPIVFIASWVSIYVQLLFPLMLLWRPTRYLALVLIMGMHLSIGLLLGLWPFSLAMIALDLLFVRDSSWRRAITWSSRLVRLTWAVLSTQKIPAEFITTTREEASPVEASGERPLDPLQEAQTDERVDA